MIEWDRFFPLNFRFVKCMSIFQFFSLQMLKNKLVGDGSWPLLCVRSRVSARRLMGSNVFGLLVNVQYLGNMLYVILWMSKDKKFQLLPLKRTQMVPCNHIQVVVSTCTAIPAMVPTVKRWTSCQPAEAQRHDWRPSVRMLRPTLPCRRKTHLCQDWRSFHFTVSFLRHISDACDAERDGHHN